MPILLAYQKNNKLKSQILRSNSTTSERIFWKQLLSCNKAGFRFYRQKPIVNYIVDFYCSKLRLAIEIDGFSHKQTWEKDRYREKTLTKLGIKTIRYNNQMVLDNLEDVYQDLCNQIDVRKVELDIS